MRNRSAILLLLIAITGFRSYAQQTDADQTISKIPMVDYSTSKEYIINFVTVEGANYMDANLLILSSGLAHGDKIRIPGDQIAQSINRLWARGYFSDIQIEAIPLAADSVDLVIHLQERPKVSNWKFKGIKKGQIAELNDLTALKRGSELSDYLIDKSEIIVKKFMNDKGFLNAEVSTKIMTDTTLSNAVDVTFVVDRKNKVKIKEIKFEGNENMSAKKLRGSLKKTHQKSINIFQNNKFNAKEFEEDKDNILDYYNARGYRNATVTRDSVYSINSKRLGIVINVDEGNKFYFRNISWVGNSIYPTDELSTMLGIYKGSLYDKKTLHKKLGVGSGDDAENPYSVKSLYQNNGYLASQIDPGEVVVGADSIDLIVRIYEGKIFSINQVDITGNLSIDDEVIRRDLDVRPGELYNRSLLMSTLRQLAQSQNFSPEIIPDLNPVSDQLVDIGFALEERKNDKVDISGGWGNGMFIGSVGLELNNLSMKNFFKKEEWRPYPQGELQSLRLQFQTNGSYYKAYSVSFTEPWLGGKKPTSLTVGTHYSSETDAYYAWLKPTQYFRTFGVYVGIGKRLRWPDRSFQFYTQVQYQLYSLKNWNYFLIENGSSNVLTLKASLTRNTVDWMIFPRSGSEFTIGVELTPPYSMFDGKDYSKNSTIKDNERYKWIEYHKWSMKAQWFTTPFKNDKFVLMAKVEMGALGSYNKDKPSPFEGYTMGGDGMSGYNLYGVDVVGLRGYENNALTPTGTYARSYNKYTAEFRYHILTQGQTTVYGLALAEAGNAFSKWSDFDPFSLKRSLGFGVRVFMPMIQMIGVDWAYGFDRVPGNKKRSGGHPHFLIGMQF